MLSAFEKDSDAEALTYVVLDLGDLGALVGVLCEGVADLDGLGLLGGELEEFIVDLLVDEDTSARAAGLTMIPAVAR